LRGARQDCQSNFIQIEKVSLCECLALSSFSCKSATTTTTTTTTTAHAPHLAIERATPPSKEDALAARLRSLRNQQDGVDGRTSRTHGAGQPPPIHSPKQGDSLRAGSTTASASSQSIQHRVTPGPTGDIGDSFDPLLQTDDQILQELLGDVSVEDQTQWSVDPGKDSQKVADLLDELSKATPATDPRSFGQEEVKDGDDDSEAGDMAREVEAEISKALDAARSDQDTAIYGEETPSASPSKDATSTMATGSDGGDQGGIADFNLPSVPSTMVGKTLSSSVDGAGGSRQNPGADDFESDIAARMAALKGLGGGSSSADTDTDTVSLPSVPTFQPSDKKVKRLTTTTNYTDQDMENWCVVCLEDATLKCPGCDDDVYCARCWAEMHVGPSAGFDERSHRAVQFGGVRTKKVALGA
jgi:hypothetical protein